MSSAKNIAEKKQKRKLTRKMIRIAVTKATFPVRNNPFSYKLNRPVSYRIVWLVFLPYIQDICNSMTVRTS